jgi:ferric-dicitrate binding protein FerR (iron transport regulator)
MNLNARERQALRSMEGGLTETDPELVARFATLSRLMAPMERPAAERIPAGRRHVVISLLALWLAVSCALIATAAALSHPGSGGRCDVLVVHCDNQTPAKPGAR